MPLPLSLVLVGDILTGRGVAPALRSPQNSLSRYQNLIAGADLAWGNLEEAPRSPLTARKPFYNAGDLRILRDAGFDGFSLANNHSLDAGESGARQTQTQLGALGLKGAGLSLGGSNPVTFWNVQGRRIALLSATQWGPFQSGTARLTRLEIEPLTQQVHQLTAQGIFVVVALHWGTEGIATISPEHRQIARQLIDAGAIAVWGHHPHVVGPIETYKGHPIFASTGNFLWDAMPTPQSGWLVRLQIDGATPQSSKVAWQTWRVAPQAQIRKSPPTPRGETRVQAIAGNFGEGANDWILWTKKPDGSPTLRALEQTSTGWRIHATGSPREVRNIETGDVNGDGRDELVVELRQRSKLDANIKPRLHIYGVVAHGFVPLWRGSMLSRPFFEWTLAPRSDAPQCDIAALERGLGGMQWLTLYRWNGFGLRVVWQHSFEGTLRGLRYNCDLRGPLLTCELSQKNGQYHLRARRLLGEDWQIEENKISHPTTIVRARP